MKLTATPTTVEIEGRPLRLRRTTGGVVELRAADDLDLARGLGFVHALDRMTQLVLTRTAGQGRLCELLRDDDSLFEIDAFMRQCGFARAAAAEAGTLDEPVLRVAEAYAAGVNAFLERHGPALLLRALRFGAEPWTVGDTLLVMKLMSYVGLAQSQQDAEKFLIQALRSGVPAEPLRRLFAPHLDDLDDELVELIRRTIVARPLLPDLIEFAPSAAASNNWAVAGRKSASGFPLECHDPHLQLDRLPAVWYESVGYVEGDYRIGVSVPGVPGLVMGRTRRLSFGFTYGFMDQVDYFLEDCRDGRYRRGDRFEALTRRDETIRRPRNSDVTISVFETCHGVVETEPLERRPPEGLHLCCAFAGARDGAAQTLQAMIDLPGARSVQDAMPLVRNVALSANWVLADRDGNIGYQQSGLLPVRRGSGLFPLPGWDQRNDWQGFVPGDRLSNELNPPRGYVRSANDEHNPPGGPLAVNLCMGDYRRERIDEVLSARDELTLDDMRELQLDLFSPQARRYLQVLGPLLPDTPAGRLLAEWDLHYHLDSRAATLFERFHAALLLEVFGKPVFGEPFWQALSSTTALLTNYFHVFDDALLGDDASWFGDEGREPLLRRVLEDVCSVSVEAIPRWGETREIRLHNILFGGTLPRWLSRTLGIDYGPLPLPGTRATLVQTSLHCKNGRDAAVGPSYRAVTDLGRDEVETVLAGGPSDRPFTPWYTSDMRRWLTNDYKTLAAEPES